MALTDSTRQQLPEILSDAGDGGVIRESVSLVLQELIEAEAAEVIGAARYERSPDRRNERSRHRPRLLATQAGDIDPKIPELRKDSFMSSVPEPRRRIDRTTGLKSRAMVDYGAPQAHRPHPNARS